MEKQLVYRINKGNIMYAGSEDAVRAHEEALGCIRRRVPVICRVGRRRRPHRDIYIIWYGIDRGMAVVSRMNLKHDKPERIPAAELMSRVKTYWSINL